MHEAYKNAKDQKKINNNIIIYRKTKSTSKYYLYCMGWDYLSIVVGTMWLLKFFQLILDKPKYLPISCKLFSSHEYDWISLINE